VVADTIYGREPRRSLLTEIIKYSLTMTQLRAIEILLRKSVPDLAKTEVQADATHPLPLQPAMLRDLRADRPHGRAEAARSSDPRDDGDVKTVRAVVTPPAFRSAAVLEGLGD
jgi:hypothetical protein